MTVHNRQSDNFPPLGESRRQTAEREAREAQAKAPPPPKIGAQTHMEHGFSQQDLADMMSRDSKAKGAKAVQPPRTLGELLRSAPLPGSDAVFVLNGKEVGRITNIVPQATLSSTPQRQRTPYPGTDLCPEDFGVHPGFAGAAMAFAKVVVNATSPTMQATGFRREYLTDPACFMSKSLHAQQAADAERMRAIIKADIERTSEKFRNVADAARMREQEPVMDIGATRQALIAKQTAAERMELAREAFLAHRRHVADET